MLLELIQTKLNYVVQEAIVVIKDIFRRYPNKCAPALLSCWIACQAAARRGSSQQPSRQQLPGRVPLQSSVG